MLSLNDFLAIERQATLDYFNQTLKADLNENSCDHEFRITTDNNLSMKDKELKNVIVQKIFTDQESQTLAIEPEVNNDIEYKAHYEVL